MKWDVENFKSFKKNTLQGFFDLRIGPLVIRGLTYHAKNGKSWVSMPGKPEIDENGQVIIEEGRPKYFPVVFIDKDKTDSFRNWAIEQIIPLLSADKGQPDRPIEDDIPF